MTHEDFVLLRKSPKSIDRDIEYEPLDGNPDVLEFRNIPVENPLGYRVLLNGAIDLRTGRITFNFALAGRGEDQGAICRLEVNGKEHGDAGRHHKQHMKTEKCPRHNLSKGYAFARPELEHLSPREVWTTLCTQAKIDHTGQYNDPTEKKR